MFQRFQRVFEWLPVSHCVNQSILVMHGGIPCSSGPYLGKLELWLVMYFVKQYVIRTFLESRMLRTLFDYSQTVQDSKIEKNQFRLRNTLLIK